MQSQQAGDQRNTIYVGRDSHSLPAVPRKSVWLTSIVICQADSAKKWTRQPYTVHSYRLAK